MTTNTHRRWGTCHRKQPLSLDLRIAVRSGCGEVLREGPLYPTSHSMCPDCEEVLYAKLEATCQAAHNVVSAWKVEA